MIKGEGKDFTLIRCESNDDWLKQRTRGIGGSDVAALLGLSKYATPLALWLQKTGKVTPEDISDRQTVEWGNRLESVVGAKYAEAHPDRKVKRVNAVAQSIERPWAQASLDYEVLDGDKWGILEIKTAGLRVADDWKEGVPLYYQTQVVHYMSVLNRDFADVAVLIGGNDYREYRIERDEDDVVTVNQAVDTFWNENVLKDIAPELQLEESANLATLFGKGDDVVAVDEASVNDVESLVMDYEHVSKELKRLTERKKELSQDIIKLIGEHSGITTNDKQVKWVRYPQTKYDMKAFEADNKELCDTYKERLEAYKSTFMKSQGLRVKNLKKGA